MKVLLKRSSLLFLLSLTLVSLGCGPKKVGGPTTGPVSPPPSPTVANPNAPAPTITLRADNTTITTGQSVTLTYAATNATTVTIQPGVGAVQPTANGTRQVTPTAATTYTATAVGPGGTASSAGVTITVNAATPPPAPPPAPPTPVTNNNTRTPDEVFRLTMVPILFDYDKSNIRVGEESKLLMMATYLKQNTNVRFQIEGHADERGGQEYNIALGDERAVAVKKYLAAQGVAETRMATVSYGEERPICREMTEDCWQRNRRAAFNKQQ